MIRVLSFCAAVLVAQVAHSAPKVLTDIAPVHSLASIVMEGVASPELLIEGQVDLHNLTLRPSQVRKLQKTEIFVTIGHILFPWIEDNAQNLAPNADIIEIIDLEGVLRIDGDQTHDGHDHETDPHMWLDPMNAKQVTITLSDILSKSDPENAPIYRKNAKEFGIRIDELSKNIAARLSHVSDVAYMMDHHALGYFENRFGLEHRAILSDKSRQTVGLRAASRIERELEGQKICLFAESSEISSFANALGDAGKVNLTVIDLVGSGQTLGASLYENLIQDLAQDVLACLSNS